VLGITAVEPGRKRLLFERFISAERREPPDIDVDFEHERREEVIQYLYTRLRPRTAPPSPPPSSLPPARASAKWAKPSGLAEDGGAGGAKLGLERIMVGRQAARSGQRPG
jgi:error-prone DNA polymerase